jgi:hypothetical protein
MIANIPWLKPALNFFLNNLLSSIWNVPPFQGNHYQSLFCDFDLHSDLQTLPRKVIHQHEHN